jgi:hypothetical protein
MISVKDSCSSFLTVRRYTCNLITKSRILRSNMPKIIALKDARSFLDKEVSAIGTVIKPSPDGQIFYLRDAVMTSLEVHMGESADKVNEGDQVTVTGVLVAGKRGEYGLFRPVMNAKSISHQPQA